MLLNNKKVLILEQFILDYDTKKYGRDIAKRLKLNQKTVANMLNELEREDILKYSREGKNKYYYSGYYEQEEKKGRKQLRSAKSGHRCARSA